MLLRRGQHMFHLKPVPMVEPENGVKCCHWYIRHVAKTKPQIPSCSILWNFGVRQEQASCDILLQ